MYFDFFVLIDIIYGVYCGFEFDLGQMYQEIIMLEKGVRG